MTALTAMHKLIFWLGIERRRKALDRTSALSVWNGHYACTCYHPLFVFNQFGDLERCALRPGNVHSADGWDAVLKPVVARYHQGKVSPIYFRADARRLEPPRHVSH
jgi:hypothetical protein